MVSEYYAKRAEARAAAEAKLKESQRTDYGRQPGTPVSMVWRCPKCKDEGVKVCMSKWTTLRKSSRYFACEGKCKRCGKKTRNVLPHVIKTLMERKEGQNVAAFLSDEWEEVID